MATIQAKSVRRREDLRLLTGQGNYTADATPPNIAVATFLRSPHAHADIGAIDPTPARTVPGVIAVYTAADLTDVAPIPGGIGFARPDGGPAPKTDRPLLAGDRVRFVGEPVALIIAATRAAGLEAAEAIAVDYSALPVVTEPIAALGSGAPAVWDEVTDNIGFLWQRGDPDGADAALARSTHVTSLDFTVSRVTANSMEPRGAWAQIAEDGRIELHASHQSPFGLRNAMAASNFQIPPTDIRVLPGDVGGSFGMKSGVHLEFVLVAWAARRLKRPVRWVADRTEGFLTDEQAREMRVTASLGVDRDGKFTALKLRWDVNLGAYVSGRSGWGVGNIGGIAGVYDIPFIAAQVCGVLTHTVPTAAYRGAGRPEATYAIERLIDVAARELGISPYELRRRNLIPPEAMPYKTALTFTYDCGEFEENMREAATLSDLASFEERRAEAAKRGKLRGIGLCNCIEVAGGPFLRPAKDLATLRLAEDGTLILRSGSMSVGQGLETTFSQLVADRFGVDVEQVRWEGGDTDLLASGKGNGGSGALCIGGSAVSLAMDKVIEKCRADRGRVAGGRSRGHRILRRPVHDNRHRPLGLAGRNRPRRARPRPYPARRGGRSSGIRRIHPDRSHLPQRHPCLRGRNRCGNWRHDNRPLQRGGGTRAGAEPDDRRWADPWGRGPGCRSGAGRDHHSRYGVGSDADRILHGLSNASRRRVS